MVDYLKKALIYGHTSRISNNPKLSYKMVDYLKKALIYGHTSRISS